MVSPYRRWKSEAQKASNGATSVEPAPVSEYALAPAGLTNPAVRLVIAAMAATIGNLLGIKRPPRKVWVLGAPQLYADSAAGCNYVVNTYV
jgi:hypothetical protein